MNVVAFKQPSFIKKVDYAKLVDELYESKVAKTTSKTFTSKS